MHIHVERSPDRAADGRLLDGSSDGLVIVGPDRRIQSANAQACALAGVEASDAVGAFIEDFVPDGGGELVSQCLDELAPDRPFDGVLRLATQGHRTGHVEVRARRLTDGRVLVLMRDIHDLRRQERAFRLLSGVLSDAHGSDFFDSLVEVLRDVLQADFAFVAEVDGRDAESMWIHAVAGPDGLERGARLPLDSCVAQTALRAGRPMPYVVATHGCDDCALPEWLGAKWGWVVPLTGPDGKATGLLGVLSRRELFAGAGVEGTLDMLASRAALEIARSKMESALRRSERHLKAMVQASARFVWGLDAEGKPTLNAERTWERVSGRKLDRETGPGEWLSSVVPEDRDRVAVEWRKAFETRREAELQYRVEAVDGSVRHLHVRAVPVFDEREEFEGYIGTIEDITEHRRAADELEIRNRALEVLRVVPEAASRGAGLQECLTEALAHNCRAWGFEHGCAHRVDQAGRMRPAAVAYPPEGTAPSCALGAGSGDVDSAQWLQLEDVEWRKEGIFVPVRVGSGAGPVTVLHFVPGDDGATEHMQRQVLEQVALQLAHVAEREERDEQVMVARRRAFEAQKLEAIGRLAGGSAHEFNNRLMVVLGEADLALGEPEVPPSVRSSLEEIRTSAQAAAAVVDRLLSFSERGSSPDGTVDLREVIAGVESVARDLLGERNTLDVELATDGAATRVAVNRGLLEQALLDMIVNAMDAMPDGGEVALRVGSARIDDLRAAQHGVGKDRFAVISVSDQGEGIPADRLDSVFEPFFTTKEQGTGLGLAATYGTVSAAGGFIEVDSQVGLGTEFRVYLPTVSDAGEGEDSGTGSGTSGEPVGAPRPVAWLVEDDERVGTVTEMILAGDGYAVVPLRGVSELRARLHEGAPGPDVLVTDWTLPDGNGADVDASVRERHPEVGTVFVSGHSEDVLRTAGVAGPARAFVGKPFGSAELLAGVRQVVAETRADRPEADEPAGIA